MLQTSYLYISINENKRHIQPTSLYFNFFVCTRNSNQVFHLIRFFFKRVIKSKSAFCQNKIQKQHAKRNVFLIWNLKIPVIRARVHYTTYKKCFKPYRVFVDHNSTSEKAVHICIFDELDFNEPWITRKLDFEFKYGKRIKSRKR